MFVCPVSMRDAHQTAPINVTTSVAICTVVNDSFAASIGRFR